MRYTVVLMRIATQVVEVQIDDATSKQDAEEQALVLAPSVDFGGKTTDYEYEVGAIIDKDFTPK